MVCGIFFVIVDFTYVLSDRLTSSCKWNGNAVKRNVNRALGFGHGCTMKEVM